jgi:hypothetical protein
MISFATNVDQPPVEKGVSIVTWTISNKYYTADVHFQIVQLKEWSPKQAEGVPAVLFVWQKGEVSSAEFVVALIHAKLVVVLQRPHPAPI